MKPRLLPEWSAVRAVLLAWPYPNGEWEGSYQEVSECYLNILKAFSAEVETWVLVHSSIEHEFKNISAKITGKNIRPLVVDYNDTWIRDYGPLSLTTGFINFQFNGWGNKYESELDNEVNAKLLQHFGKLYEAEFVAEGGALEINDDGILLGNKDCLVDKKRNPALSEQQVLQKLQKTLGVKGFALLEDVALSGDDTDGHIDTLARFVNNKHVVYCGNNDEHPDSEKLISLERQLRILAEKFNWALTALPSPFVKDSSSERVLAASYANFLICNTAVFVPVYEVSEDEIALEIFKNVFPKYRIIPIACRALLAQNGSLHCASMQLAEAAWSLTSTK